jgi:hypothetical protein
VACGDSVIDAVLPPCDHVNVPPATFAVAVKVPVAPSQIIMFGTVIIGNGVTVTVLVAIALVHPFNVYSTSYVVVTCGLTLILCVVSFVVIQLKDPLGMFGVAVICVVSPKQMFGLFTLTVGVGFTVTVMSSVAVQPFHVYNTLYKVVVFGLTVMLAVGCPFVHIA